MKKLLIFLALALGALAQPSTPINNLAIQNGGTLVANSRLIYMASGRAAGSANLTFTDGTTTGQLIHPVGAVGTPSVTFLGDLDNGLYYVTTNHLGMAIGGAVNTRWVARATLWLAGATRGAPKPEGSSRSAEFVKERESEFMPCFVKAIVIPGVPRRPGRAEPRAAGEPRAPSPQGQVEFRGYELNEEPQPQVDFAFGFLIAKPPPMRSSL